MKKLFILMTIVLLFAGCKKDDEITASMVELKDETIEKGWDYLKISAEYSYPEALKAVNIYLSENSDMSGAELYECNLDGKKISLEVKDLKDGLKYYYHYEYDNGYEKKKGEKREAMTFAKPVVSQVNISELTITSAKLESNVTSVDGVNKIVSRGFCWGTSQNPTTEGLHTTEGSGTGTFTSHLTNLIDNTTYYVRAYAINAIGTIYGEERSFKTVEIIVPTVSTNDIINITTNSAECGGNVTSDGNGTVTARGVCWSTTQNPTIADSHTTDGSGTGAFTSNMTNLTENTTYYVRAYATNEKGTVYGEEKSFMTEKRLEPVEITVNGVSFVMIGVNGGTFSMGAQADDPNGINYDSDADDWEKPVHSVTLSDYYIGETEVTQELWEAVMGSNPSHFSGDQKPVEMVSWNDCQEFISKLNALTGKNFRLPTEAEWEYAARGGNMSEGYKYSGSNTIDNVAWYDDNSSQTHNVKSKSPNELGIYDMSGNVWEWCQDWYDSDYYSSSPQNNPQGPSSGSSRVVRGGSWYSYARSCRVSLRGGSNPDSRYDGSGLRLSFS